MSPILYFVRRYLCWAAFGAFAVVFPFWQLGFVKLSLEEWGVRLLLGALVLVTLRATVGIVTNWSSSRADGATAFVLGWFAVGCLAGLLAAATCSAFEPVQPRSRHWTPYQNWTINWTVSGERPTLRSVVFVSCGGLSVVCLALLARRKTARWIVSFRFLIGVVIVAVWWLYNTGPGGGIFGAVGAMFAWWVRSVMKASRPPDEEPTPALVPTTPSR